MLLPIVASLRDEGVHAFNDPRLSNMTCSGQFVAQEQIQPMSAHTHLIASHPMAIKDEWDQIISHLDSSSKIVLIILSTPATCII